MKKSVLYFAIAAAISLPNISQANDAHSSANPSSSNELERLVVTANRSQQKISDIASTVWLVDLADIETQINSGADFKNALAQLVPGLDLASQSRTNYGQNMRGRKMMVMIDGVSLNSSRGVSRHLDSIDPFNIARIEVLSAATAIYGGGSTGGVINIITKKGNGQHELSAAMVSGASNSDDSDTKLAAATSWQTDNSKTRLALAYQSTQASYDGDGKQIMLDTTQSGLQYTDSIDFIANSEIKLDDQQTVSLMGQYYRNQSDGEHGLYFGEDVSALFGDMSQVEVRKGLDSEHTPQTKRTLINANYHHQAFFGHQLNLQAFIRSEDFDFYPRPRLNSAADAVASFSSSQQNTNAAGFKLVLVKDIEQLNIAYGIDYNTEEFEAIQTYYDTDIAVASGGLSMQSLYDIDRYPGFEVDGQAIFAQASWQASDALTLSAGLRHQTMKNTVHDFVGSSAAQQLATGTAKSAEAISGGNTDYSVNLLNLGGIYDLTDNQQVWLNFSQAFELPNVAKYYGKGSYLAADEQGHLAVQPGTSVSVNNSKLKGIKTDAYELGWRYADGDLNSQLSVYHSQSDQTISYNKTTLLIDVNDKPLRTLGIEGQVNYDLNADWQLGLTAHLINKQSKTADGQWAKVDVTQASSSKLTSFVRWQADNLSLRLQSKTMLDLEDERNKFNESSSNRKIEGYTLFDLVMNYALEHGQVNFAINNLLDKSYTTQWGQRSIYFYSPKYGPEALYDHKGRGRNFAINYNIAF